MTSARLDKLLGRPWWHAEAACRGTPPDWWWPGRGAHVPEEALALCAACPVASECLAWALAHPSLVGTCAGTDELDRRRLRGDRVVS